MRLNCVSVISTPPQYHKNQLVLTRTRIVIGGFSGWWGFGDFTLGRGDVVLVKVWNPQSGEGPAEISTTVIGERTVTTLSSSPNPSGDGEAVTFTATVDSAIGAPPNGETISFMQGGLLLGKGTLSDGSTTFTTSALKAGTDVVTAAYGGDSDFDPRAC